MSRFVIAASLGEALDELAAGPVKILAGGTDLMIALRQARLACEEPPPALLDITRVPELRRLSPGADEPFVGAAITFTELASTPEVQRRYPALAQAAGSVGSLQIRNTGTIGGNAANASPAADGVCALTALGARALAASVRGERVLPLEELITGPGRNSLEPDELVVGFYLDKAPPGAGQAFAKAGRRQAMAVARLNLAACLDPELAQPRLTLGSCFPSPRRLTHVESFLTAEGVSPDSLAQAGKMAAEEFTNVCGLRSSAAYKLPAIAAMTRQVLALAWERRGGGK